MDAFFMHVFKLKIYQLLNNFFQVYTVYLISGKKYSGLLKGESNENEKKNHISNMRHALPNTFNGACMDAAACGSGSAKKTDLYQSGG